MTRLAAALLLALALGACNALQPVNVSEPISSASALNPEGTGEELENAGVVTEENAEAEEDKQPEPIDTEPSASDVNGNQRKIEYIELTVDITVPNGQKDLVKYLMSPKKFRLVQCVQINAKQKYWKFLVIRTKADEASPALNLPVDLDN